MKISFIGSGKVGATIAYTAALKGLAQEIVMVDAFSDKARGEALDILQCQAFAPQARIRQGEINDTVNSDIVVISAGTPRRADEARVLLLARNARLVADIVKEVVIVSPNCILLMITNPLDVMTQLAYDISGLPAGRVIGMGTVLDTARYRSVLAERFNVDARDIDAYVVGEHGETMVTLTSGIHVKGIPLSSFSQYSPAVMKGICDEVQAASGQVISLKGGTVFAPAVSACTILAAIIGNSRQVLPVCSYNDKHGVAMSLPSVVGRAGIESILDIPMTGEEHIAVDKSIVNIKSYTEQLAGFLE